MTNFEYAVAVVETLPDDSRPTAQRTAIALLVAAMNEAEWEAFVAGELEELREGVLDEEWNIRGQW